MNQPVAAAPRIAVLVDCDNTSPEALECVLNLIPKQEHIAFRQGYGNDSTMDQQRWREALSRHAFLALHQFGNGKNAADIALALDAYELLVDGRADTFYLLTSDADFTPLCRKLRTRGGTVIVVGQSKAPLLLREACSRFHELTPFAQVEHAVPKAHAAATPPAAPAVLPAAVRKPPKVLLAAVAALATEESNGWVRLSALGEYLRDKYRIVPKQQGYASLGKMIADCAALQTQTTNGTTTVRLINAPGNPANVTAIRPTAK